MSLKSKPLNPAGDKAAWFNRLLTLLLAGTFGLALAQRWRPLHLPGNSGWLDAVLLLLALASTIAALSRHLPMQNVLFAACFIAFTGGAADWLDLKTGIPFGVFTPEQNNGLKLFHALPWALPVIWALAILNSRGVARLVLRPWRKTKTYGFQLIGITAALTVLFDLAFDPFAARVKHYWFWEPTKFPLAWQGAPLVNFFGWAVVTLLILAFITPMLVNKQPTFRRPPDFHPLGVWLGAILLFGAGAAVAGLWPAAALDGIIGIAVAVFAIRGARW